MMLSYGEMCSTGLIELLQSGVARPQEKGCFNGRQLL